MMRTVLLFGAGKSSTVLIDYLLKEAATENWRVIVADANIDLAKSKVGVSSYGVATEVNINDDIERGKWIRGADIVISLLPPALHILVAKDCVKYSKNLLTASYADDSIRQLEKEIDAKGLFFLCEMGLDPGIDHMSAMRVIDQIRSAGGRVVSFRSHCGGLVAPASDDNPWHYKISWNPRNIVLAGKNGAHYRENGKEERLSYEELFNANRIVAVPGLDYLSWYPNRDSLSYAPLYGLEDTATFMRTTLRHPDFMYGWKNIIDLKFTDETPQYDTDNKTLYQVFKEHMDKNGFGQWLEAKLMERFSQTKEMLENLMKLMEAEKEAGEENEQLPEEFMTVTDKGELEQIEMDDVKDRAAGVMAHKMHEANLTLKQLFYLGLDDQETMVNKGFCSAADVLQFALEKKLALQPDDKDMIVMLHEMEVIKKEKRSLLTSSLIVKGENSLRTAMAKTVGLPLGIAAKLILNKTIQLKGLFIPTKKEIYEPVLKELESFGIKFSEEEKYL
jgi:saccharopine dehydrogenase-like NADP-dependent oxidoreductase